MNKNWPVLGTPNRVFLDEAVKAAQQCEREIGVPTCITLAQAILESAWGTHHAGAANNYFGIKAGPGWTGRKMALMTKEHSDEKGWFTVSQDFRAYRTMGESFADHGKFLKVNKRYASLFKLARTDYKNWAKGLQEAGYATDPTYAAQLVEIIERYGLQFYNLPSSDKQ